MATITSPPPAYLQAKIDGVVAQIGHAPASLTTSLEDGKRVATLTFPSVDDVTAWAMWLHWPFATTARAGRHVVVAYGQWLGFACHLTADEPLAPVPADS